MTTPEQPPKKALPPLILRLLLGAIAFAVAYCMAYKLGFMMTSHR